MKKQENILQFINEKNISDSLKWELNKFPHAIIENFENKFFTILDPITLIGIVAVLDKALSE